jgi:dihydrofolate synthase/folylpolyglutamate synthase
MSQAGSPLTDWLRRLETFSPHEIEFGLDRVLAVLERMALARPARVIHVGGTNGKGSSVAMLRSLLSVAGTGVGTYMSPHVFDYNERICIDGKAASDEQIVAAFEQVETARAGIALTYFEYGTLAALAVFDALNVDTAILEVGMGGRLDAVNAVDPDAALITNVSLDHCDWLGNDIESIAFEKAGIMRRDVPVVFADRTIPETILRQAAEIGATLIAAGRDYDWTLIGNGRWGWRGQRHEIDSLAPPSLAGPIQVQNAAGVLALVEALGLDSLISSPTIDSALGSVSLPGRMQSLTGEPESLFDVAHNPSAAAALAETLAASGVTGLVAIVGMLDDKDVEGVVAPLAGVVERWIAVTAASPRAIDAAELARRIANKVDKACLIAESADAAVAEARNFAANGGRILVTGSFYVVGPMLERLSARD